MSDGTTTAPGAGGAGDRRATWRGATLRGAAAFFLWELRRGSTVAAVGLVSVLLVAVVQRLGAGEWVEASVDWRTAGAVFALFVMAPVLAFALAGQWLRERRDGSLRWLYARPLAGWLLFAVRLAALVVSLALFVACALLLLGVAPAAVVSDAAAGSRLLFRGGLLLVCLGLPAALFASAAGRTGGRAGGLFLTAVGAAFLLAASLRALLPVPVDLLADPEAVAWRHDLLLFVALPLALLAGAAAAVWRAVEDRRVLRRAVLAAGAVAAVAWLLAAAATVATTWGRPVEEVVVRSLGDGAVLRLSTGRGVHPLAAWAAVESADGIVHELGDWLVAGQPFVDRTRGRALVLRAGDLGGWGLVDRDGNLRWLPSMPLALAVKAVGWSPEGRFFAFRCGGLRHVGRDLSARAAQWFADGRAREGAPACVRGGEPPSLLLIDGESGEMQALAIPEQVAEGADWWAVWLDDDRLLVTVSYYSSEGIVGRWLVADRRQPGVPTLHDVDPAGAWLQPVATLQLSGELEGLPPALLPPSPRRDGAPLLWRHRDRRRALVSFDTTAAAPPETNPVRALTAERSPRWNWWTRMTPQTLGTLADGTAVWLESTAGGFEVKVLPANDNEVRTVCRLASDNLRALPGAYRGAVGRRAFWDTGDGNSFVSCDLASGRIDRLGGFGVRGALAVDVLPDGLLRSDDREVSR